MISLLHIKNIGIIDDLEIEFNKGVNVLTGETGAGKSLIIDSLSLICGGRFQKELIRNGEEYSLVEACIENYNENIKEVENIVVSRKIYVNGKNICKINGELVSVNELKEHMQNIIDIHEQNDNQKIMDTSTHINYLDLFIGNDILQLKSKYCNLYAEYKRLKNEIEASYGDEIKRSRTLDLLKYQLEEIDAASLKVGEDKELEEKRELLHNSQKISEALENSSNILSNKILEEMDIVVRYLNKISSYDKRYQNNLDIIQDSYYNLQDTMEDISSLKEEVEYNSISCQSVETRLDNIYSLKRKYGNSIEEILNYRNEISAEIDKIENIDEYVNNLKDKLAKLSNEMYDLAKNMNNIRKENVNKLEMEINNNLKDLEMPSARFNVEICFDEKLDFNLNGLNNVEFKISTNIGDGFKSLVKIASGGEISRIMLAIKTVLNKYDSSDVMVLDEIDTGISGKAAKAVGEKIRLMSKNTQVICVTHLPVVAACADYNYYISKSVNDGKTCSKVDLLNEQDVIKEIARITSGDLTEISFKHAVELRRCVKIA